MPLKNEQDTVQRCLRALLNSEGDVGVDVRVLSNGSTDDTVARARSCEQEFLERGWRLNVEEFGAIGKIQALKAGLETIDSGPVLLLDGRVVMHPQTLQMLMDELQDPNLDVVSGHLVYPPSGDRIVRAFARAYGRSPYARAKDLKGTCVLFAEDATWMLRDAPEVAADDRYYLTCIPRNRRTRVDGAYVDYYFAQTARGLVKQQARWVSSNRIIDEGYPDYEHNVHELLREPHFAAPKPALIDQLVYVGVLGAGHVIGRLRPTSKAHW